jgi:malonate decarboxylase beta subunit
MRDVRLPESYIELSARARAMRLLDPGSFREILGPFDRIESTWLLQQGIVAQADDGVVIAQGSLTGRSAVAISIEGAFQGGSVGEVSGSKILCALQLARRDCEQGHPRVPLLLLETGGVRLQEANLGLELISEIQAEIVALRQLVPVICVIAGMIGCFGGMSIAAYLCSYILMTPQGRLGLNGPEVIEQEAGREEIDASDRQLIWGLIGGRQRVVTGYADALMTDDCEAIRNEIIRWADCGPAQKHRSSEIDYFLDRLEMEQTQKIQTSEDVRSLTSLTEREVTQ